MDLQTLQRKDCDSSIVSLTIPYIRYIYRFKIAKNNE